MIPIEALFGIIRQPIGRRHEDARIPFGERGGITEVEFVSGAGKFSTPRAMQHDALFSRPIEERNDVRIDILPRIDINVDIRRTVADVGQFHFQISFGGVPVVTRRAVGHYQ